MAAPLRPYRRFVASTRGVVAVEFAAILPVLLILLLATFDGGNTIAVYMKVRAAAYTLAAVTNTYSTAVPISSSEMSDITGAAAQVLAPYSGSPVVVVSELSVSAAKTTTGTVRWSATLNGTALSAGSSVTLPSTLNTANNNTCNTYPCYLILAQVSYTYTPLFTYFSKSGITLSDTVYATPRSSNCIPYALQASPASPSC